MIPVRSFAESNRGLIRSENEDSYVLLIPDDAKMIQRKGILAVVADGVGGGPAGKLASSMAVQIVRDTYYGSATDDNVAALREALQVANDEIYITSRRVPGLRGMATTCTALALIDGEVLLCHAGDSRAYILSKNKFVQISEDHTLVAELMKDGIINAEQARRHPQRNIILKSLGSVQYVEPQTRRADLEGGGIVLLCSDGLHGYVTDQEISSILWTYPVEEAGRKLIGSAFEKGAPDNVTVIVLQQNGSS